MNDEFFHQLFFLYYQHINSSTVISWLKISESHSFSVYIYNYLKIYQKTLIYSIVPIEYKPFFNSSIRSIGWNLTVTTVLSLSGRGSNSNRSVLQTPKFFRTKVSLAGWELNPSKSQIIKIKSNSQTHKHTHTQTYIYQSLHHEQGLTRRLFSYLFHRFVVVQMLRRQVYVKIYLLLERK